ncbi:Sorting nexin-4 [Liparis tanakae]|uniref:Sorting nexin-4 n=1 Tax=Liparis tanakae TaxID=230148 RepID=A0A4Z2E3E8_9TELE|nr:Sorting nexin-4 [Liparis tanakae]
MTSKLFGQEAPEQREARLKQLEDLISEGEEDVQEKTAECELLLQGPSHGTEVREAGRVRQQTFSVWDLPPLGGDARLSRRTEASSHEENQGVARRRPFLKSKNTTADSCSSSLVLGAQTLEDGGREHVERAWLDMQRFNEQKDRDLREALISYAVMQISMCKKGVQVWSNAKECFLKM